MDKENVCQINYAIGVLTALYDITKNDAALTAIAKLEKVLISENEVSE